MQCEEVREQFASYVIGQIEETAHSLVDQHLKSCDSCRSEAAELKRLWITLGSIPAADPSPEMRTRFDIMLEAYRQGLDHAPKATWWESVNTWLSGWWPKRPAIQFGLALALLILGVVVGRQFYPASVVNTPIDSELAKVRDELYQTRQMVALSLMQQQSASDRLKGVNWSYRLQQPSAEVLTALLDALMHDTNVNVRLATVDALRQFGDQPAVRRGVVEAMARQESAMVQIALIDLAVDLREKESITALRELTQDSQINGAVRERAQRGLAELE